MNEMIPGMHLSEELVALIAQIAAPLGAASSNLVRQAEAATIVRGSPTMVDVVVPAELPGVSADDGPLPRQALVHDGDQLVGEILVWIRAGRLIGLEQTWFTEDSPTTWPAPDRVRLA
jgi:hypothetical protein